MNLNKFKDVINSMEDYKEFKIILFDGICNLCNASVNFIIDKDKNQDQKFEGIISWISQQAEFTPKIIQIKEEKVKVVYAVKIKT